jgi:hypothetical protein
MNVKNIFITGITGGFILGIASIVADTIVQIISPYDIFKIGGMRAMNDPILMLYFLYWFVFAFITAIVWSYIRESFIGSTKDKALKYAGILFLLVIVPNIWVMASSMTYPLGFYISNILSGLIGYPCLGYLNARYNSK